MSKNLAELHEERGRLLERIAGQRANLSRQLAPLQKASDKTERLMALLRSGLNYLQTHPLPATLAVAALVLVKPGRSLRLAGRGLMLWRSWRMLRTWVPPAWLGRWFRSV
jgi:hypothetical protein